MNIDLSLLKIRKVRQDDVSCMTAHRLAYLTELQGERDENYKKELRKELEKYFREGIEAGSFFAFLAEYNHEPVAFGGMVIKCIPGDFSRASYLEGDILNMYTIPEVRRNGISSLILTELLNEAKNMGISKVSLHTSKDGEKLYKKYGFKEPEYPVLEFLIS